VRDKIAFVQDAFVRDVNAAEVVTSGEPAIVDNPALAARLLADARRVMGAGKIASIAIMQVQIAPLDPGPVTAVAPGSRPPIRLPQPRPSRLKAANSSKIRLFVQKCGCLNCGHLAVFVRP
jgi:hypothetical protein